MSLRELINTDDQLSIHILELFEKIDELIPLLAVSSLFTLFIFLQKKNFYGNYIGAIGTIQLQGNLCLRIFLHTRN